MQMSTSCHRMSSQVSSFRVLCGAFFGRPEPSAAFSEGVGADASEGTCKYLEGMVESRIQTCINISYLWAVLDHCNMSIGNES